MFKFFEIIRNKKIFMKLQLPQSIKIHNIFDLNLLYKALIDPLTNQVNKPPLLIIINNKKKWEVKDIFDTRSYYNKL